MDKKLTHITSSNQVYKKTIIDNLFGDLGLHLKVFFLDKIHSIPSSKMEEYFNEYYYFMNEVDPTFLKVSDPVGYHGMVTEFSNLDPLYANINGKYYYLQDLFELLAQIKGKPLPEKYDRVGVTLH